MSVLRFIRTDILPVLKNARALKALMTPGDHAGALPPAFQYVATPEEVDILARQALTGAPIIAMRDGRVSAQTDRHRRLTQVIAERAKEMGSCRRCGHAEAEHPYQGVRPDGSINECAEYRGIPGGATGLLVGKLKPTGIEYQIDTGLLSELREHEKHIAIEMGQWQENIAGGSVSVQIISPAANDGSLPRVDFSQGDTIEVDDCEVIGARQ